MDPKQGTLSFRNPELPTRGRDDKPATQPLLAMFLSEYPTPKRVNLFNYGRII